MSQCPSLLNDLEDIPLPELKLRLDLFKALLGDIANYQSLCALQRDLDITLSRYNCIYFERTFTSLELEGIPKYLVYRYHGFNVPLDHPVDRGIDIEEIPSESSSVKGVADHYPVVTPTNPLR